MLCTRFMFQEEINAMHLGAMSSKVPPSWCPEKDRQYPLRAWTADIRLWALGTDVDALRQGPVAAGRIIGTARDLIRELDPNVLSAGGVFADDQGNPMQFSGLECLIRALTRRYGPLAQELEIFVIGEILLFKRNPGEDVDSCVSRFELVRTKAFNGAGFDMSWVGFSFLLLTILGIRKEGWPLLLAPTQGSLPNTQQQYQDFCGYVRRHGHLSDRNVDPVKNMQFFSHESEQQQQQQTYWSSWPHPATFQQSEPSYNSIETEFEDEADDGLSSCNSGESVPDLSDLHTMPVNIAGEQLYLAYRHAKRRWRRFAGGVKRLHYRRFNRKGTKGSKGFRRQHTGKGHKNHFGGKGPGKPSKGKGRMFFLDDYGTLQPVDEDSLNSFEPMYFEQNVDDEQVVYLAGGKGGKFKRKNPKGKDGKTLQCSLCGSEDHLIKQCSQNTSGLTHTQHKQQHQKSFPSLPSAAPAYSAPPSSSSSTPSEMSQWSAPWYFTVPVPENVEPVLQEPACTIQIGDQLTELSQPSNALESDPATRRYYMPNQTPRPSTLSEACSNKSALEKQFAFAWFMPYFHAQVRGEGFEGLLIDVGAIGNLAGSEFIKRICSRALQFGQNSSFQKLSRPLSVEGVGNSSDETEQECTAPICLTDGRTGSFTTPVIQNSSLPALLGLKTLSKERALIDCFNNQIVFIGPGGYRLQASPGSRTYQLKTAKSGHLLLPCDCWENARFKDHEKQLAF